MKNMACIQIKEVEIQGIKLIDVVWKSTTGRVEAISRAQDANQYSIGSVYSGRLKYAPGSDIRIFEPMFKVGYAYDAKV